MDIQQLKDERRKLATDISELVNSSQRRTELRFPVRVRVTVRIQLGS
jgi:hypothetical protein